MRAIFFILCLSFTLSLSAQENRNEQRLMRAEIVDSLARATMRTFYHSVESYNKAIKKIKIPLGPLPKMSVKKGVARMKAGKIEIILTPSLMLAKSIRVNGRLFRFKASESYEQTKTRLSKFIKNSRRASFRSPIDLIFPLAYANVNFEELISTGILTYSMRFNDDHHNCWFRCGSEKNSAIAKIKSASGDALDSEFIKEIEIKAEQCDADLDDSKDDAYYAQGTETFRFVEMLGMISRDMYYRESPDQSAFYNDGEEYAELKKEIRTIIDMSDNKALTCQNIMNEVHGWRGPSAWDAAARYASAVGVRSSQSTPATSACDKGPKGPAAMSRLKTCLQKYAYNAKKVFDGDGSLVYEGERENMGSVISTIEGKSSGR